MRGRKRGQRAPPPGTTRWQRRRGPQVWGRHSHRCPDVSPGAAAELVQGSRAGSGGRKAGTAPRGTARSPGPLPGRCSGLGGGILRGAPEWRRGPGRGGNGTLCGMGCRRCPGRRPVSSGCSEIPRATTALRGAGTPWAGSRRRRMDRERQMDGASGGPSQGTGTGSRPGGGDFWDGRGSQDPATPELPAQRALAFKGIFPMFS